MSKVSGNIPPADLEGAPPLIADRRRDLAIAAALREAAQWIAAKALVGNELTLVFRDDAQALAFHHQVNRLQMDDIAAELISRGTVDGMSLDQLTALARRRRGMFDEQDG
jgi:hypothetical protein